MNDTEFKALLESAQVLIGNGEPAASIGNELDLFIDQDERRFWRKCNGVWTDNAAYVLGPLFLTLVPPVNADPDVCYVPIYRNGNIEWKQVSTCGDQI